ncbi:NifB/NifX family molybdenum-iron cluster-binding protein [Patescibacteria group bacterium]|nr:NifB/NifX family molybdenum-iron cluster-binding protein [Patescibacteria group bacterium]
MRVGIASNGKDENAKVSEVSGRAPYYLIFENGKLSRLIKNPFKIGGGGAGFGVAEMLSDEKVEMVVSGKFGANMIGVLESKGIRYKEVSNITVREALEIIE